MSQASKNALALHEILLSIADSLNVAQQELRSMPPYDEYGRPNTLYQLPYLDYSLEVNSEVTSETESENQTGDSETNSSEDNRLKLIRRNQIFKPKRQLMAFKFATPSDNKSENNSTSNKITSTISGRFVAVLPNEGVPQIFIEMIAEKESNIKYNLKVKLTYATNEPVVENKVEINFDEATTLAINESESDEDDLGELTETPIFFPTREGFTNNQGVYETSVQINSNDTDKTIIFVANSGTIQTSVAINNT